MAMEADYAGTVEFRFDQPQASELFLVGSFNGWNPCSHPMRRDDRGQWVCTLQLPAGAYQFYYLARMAADGGLAGRSGAHAQWRSSDLDFMVVTPRGGSFQSSTPMASADAAHESFPADGSSPAGLEQALLPLSRLESALIRGFRRLPDHESRSAFLDVLEESVYS